MSHWLQLVNLANSSSSASNQSIASIVQKEVAAQLRNSGVDRSRTPRGGRVSRNKRESALQLTGPQQPALPCPSCVVCAEIKPQEQGKGKRKGEESRSGKASTSRHDLAAPRRLKGGEEVTKLFHQSEGYTIWYAFQEGTCQQNPCSRRHVCLGCGGARGYNQCQCLQSRLAALS